MNEVPMMMANMDIAIKYTRLLNLEQNESKLKKADALISRLRAENKAYRLERRGMRARLQCRAKRLGIRHQYGFRLAAMTIGISVGIRPLTEVLK